MDNVKRLLILLDLINLKHRHLYFFSTCYLYYSIWYHTTCKSMTSYVLFNEQILCTYLHYTLFTQMVNQALAVRSFHDNENNSNISV